MRGWTQGLTQGQTQSVTRSVTHNRIRGWNQGWIRTFLVLVLGLGGALALASCGQQNGVALAQQACTHIDQSIQNYNEAQKIATIDPGRATALRRQAAHDLITAIPIAAEANSINGQWNPLVTTLSESSTINEGHLESALNAQCQMAKSGQVPGLLTPTTLPKDLPPVSSTKSKAPSVSHAAASNTTHAG